MPVKGFRLRLYRSLLGCSCIRWHCWVRWRLLVTVAVVFVYALMLLVVLPLMIVGLYEVHAKVQFSAWFVAGVFVLLTIPIFLANLLQHLFNYTKPHLQAYIMRILWIVPVYSIDSWLGLKFPASAIYWSTVRECYESYALYNFLVYLLHFLGEEYILPETMATRPPVKHPFPFCCCKPWPEGMRFIKWCKVGVLQYAVIRPILTVLALIFQWAGIYKEGHLGPDRAYLYIALANAISQSVALYCLLYFYKGLQDLLKPMKPVLKFGAIKAIIIFTFWQALILSFLVKINVIKQSIAWGKYGFSDVATSIQDFIICIEMLIAAISFYFIFSHKPYIDPAATQIPCLQSFIEMMDVRDIYGDVKENFMDPIPVPRLPMRLSRERQISRDKEEMQPLMGGESNNLSGYESGGEGGVRKERLGSGEDSLVMFSIPSNNHHILPSPRPPPVENEIIIEDRSLSSGDDQDLLVRERRTKNDFRTS